MVRDAEWPARGYVALIAAHLPAEPMVSIVEASWTSPLHQVTDRYLPLRARGAAFPSLAGVCRSAP